MREVSPHAQPVEDQLSVTTTSNPSTEPADGAAPTPPPVVRPPWAMPAPLAHSEGVQAAGTVAAPFLAGFSLTCLVLVLQGADESSRSYARPSDLCVILLAAAAVFLVFAVQFALQARAHQVTPSQVFEWWGNDATAPERGALGDLSDHLALNRMWSRRAEAAYNVGLLLLLGALPLILVPTGPAGEVSAARWVAIGLGVVGFLGEVGWMIYKKLTD